MNQESTENSNQKNAPGARLKAAKIEVNLSSAQVASRLNLTVELIESIERDDFQETISPAFYRGYLRSYAQLVGIDADPLIEMYNNIIHQGSLSVSITPTFDTNLYTKKERNYPYLKWLLYLLVAISIISAIYFIWNKKFKSSDPKQTEIRLNADTELNPSEISLTGLIAEEPKLQKKDSALVSTQAINLKKKSEEKSDNTSTTKFTNEAAVLKMDFKGDCWVKVTDVNGEVLAIGIKRTGKSMSLEGMAPFSVILGNAAVVTMSYNQQSINLSGFPAGNRVELQISSESELLQ